MAFQLDSNVYSKQKSLSDYMAVNEARDLQRAQAEQSIAASDMTMQAAKQKQEMEKVGMGLAGATEADYPARRQALLKQGVPEQFLPEQYNPELIDAIMTKTGYKSKPSLAEQLMQPLSMMMGVQQPTPEPTQEAAPIQTGSITTQPVGNIDQYAVDQGLQPPTEQTMDSLTEWGASFEKGGQKVPVVPPSNQQMMPPTLPAQIPDTNLSTPIPAYQPKTVGAAFEADKAAAKASAENQALATKPMTPKEKLARQESYGKANLAFSEAKRATGKLVSTAQEALALLESDAAGGWSSVLGSKVPNSDARSLENKIATIKANALVKALGNMRAASPTGGAVGALSDKEGALLSALEGALDTGDPVELKKTLQMLIDEAPQVIAERESALGQQYPDLFRPENKQSPSTSAQQTIKWDELP